MTRSLAAFILWSVAAEVARPADLSPSRADKPVTYQGQIASLLKRHCVECHQPGQSAPFPLVTFEQAKKKGRELVEATAKRLMPPWLPEETDYPFAHARRLEKAEIDLLREWFRQGMPEGSGGLDPHVARPLQEWSQGPPDLILSLPESFPLAAEGADVYRNFAISTGLREARWIRSVEIRPENPRLVHHAVFLVDPTPGSRNRDAADKLPGFGEGMALGSAQLPDGFFFGWTPGKVADAGDPKMAFSLQPGTDVVLQLHLRRSGKAEKVQARIGLYFASAKPERRSYSLVMRNKMIDLAPGEKNFQLNQSFQLPVTVELRSIYPHAHYLAREMMVDADLPSSGKKRLLWIKEWDFDWQDSYRLQKPVLLPAGTVLTMRYSYDNSENNSQNRHRPPRRVRYGPNSDDEMGEVLLQLIPGGEQEEALLRHAGVRAALETEVAALEWRLKKEPPSTAVRLALADYFERLGQGTNALAQYQLQLKERPGEATAYYRAGHLLSQLGNFSHSIEMLTRASELAPEDPQVWRRLAQVHLDRPGAGQADFGTALKAAGKAVEVTRGKDAYAYLTLARACESAQRPEESRQALEKAATLARENNDPVLLQLLGLAPVTGVKSSVPESR